MKDEIQKQCAANVRKTCYLLMRTIGTAFSKRTLSLREFIALTCIKEENGASLAIIAEQIGCTVSGASKLVKRLELNYVIRSAKGKDCRRQIVNLTEDGDLMLENINHEDMSYLILLLSTLKPAECEMINITMDLIRQGFTADHSQSNKMTEQKGKL